MTNIKYMSAPRYCNNCGNVYDCITGKVCTECNSINTTPIKIAYHTKLNEKQLMSFPKKDLVNIIIGRYWW